MNQPTIVVREVWARNLDEEFSQIRTVIDRFPFVSMDTEFPGTVFKQNNVGFRVSKSTILYSFLKRNVDAMKIIQIGITLTDSNGELPDLGSDKERYIWQFNFMDFDVTTDPHSPSSIEMLKEAGLDFEGNVENGVESVKFGELMMSSGLVCNDEVTWVTFHCPYDFGYLVKILTQRELPGEVREFLDLVTVFFGARVFDVKYMMRYCDGLYGGLNQVAKDLRMEREIGMAHQSGSDSLLTWRLFKEIHGSFFGSAGRGGLVEDCAGQLYGLVAY